jgi:predicted hydrocarbon binding protein
MVIRDKVVAWYIQHYILPHSQIIDKPGFVIFKVSYKTNIYSRQFILPETLLVCVERLFIERYKKTGEQALYSIGKKFGYRFTQVSRVINIRDTNKKSFLRYVFILSKFVEGTYASSIFYKVNLESSIINFKLKDFVICRRSGIGYLISVAGIAGIWSLMLQDPTVEAVQPKCQGRGDKECEVIAAPYETLVKMGYKPLKCRELENLELDEQYEQFNQIRPTKWAKHSLRSLIDSGFFEFKHGQVTYEGERFFLCEASFMYILEKELKKLKSGLKILWEVSFDFGERLAKISGKQDPSKFISDFFPALGFGDILVTKKEGKYKIYVNYFPWTKWVDEIDFVMFRGLLSGVVSGFIGKKVELKKCKKDISAGYLSLIAGYLSLIIGE